MVSDFVMTELHLRRTRPTPKPIGMGSYNMDSHNVQRYVARGQDGRVINLTVTEVGDETITVDGNHPLAGKPLTFDIELVSIG